MDTFQHPASLRQRLRFELQGLQSRDLEQQSVGAVRVVLNGVRNGPLVKPAVQELLSDLGSSSKQAVKLRLQLTEYCLLKCASRAQLPALVPLLLKQANNVLANNRSDAGCVSSLAALMSSMLAKMLHEPATSSYAQLHGATEASRFLTADGLCKTLLYPVIKGTYRDPEQSRVSAGSVVLLGMLEVMKAYAGQSYEVQEAIRRCLTLMLQLLGQGSSTLRVPGVLLPASVCLEALGASISEDVAKRLLMLCLKSTAVTEVWQVRRDALQTLEMLVTVLQPMVLVPLDSAAASAAQEALTIRAPATDVLVGRKQQMLQVLEDARYDKIAAVRSAAAAALTAVASLPDPPTPSEPAVCSQPATPTTQAADTKRKKWDNTPSSSAGKRRGLVRDARSAKQALAASGQQPRIPRFSRPQHTPGTVLDYGIQVFAPPSPPKRPSPAPAATPDAAHGLGSAMDQSSVKRQLSFDKHGKADTPDRLRQSVDASSQTNQAEQMYTVHTPGVASCPTRSSAGGLAASSRSPPPAAAAAAAGRQLFPADAFQLLDQNQQQSGLSAMLAACSGSPARVGVSHHVHGRVELGIVYNPVPGSPIRSDIAAAMAASAFMPPHAAGQPADTPPQSVAGDTAVSNVQHTWWPHNHPGEQQQQQQQGQQQQWGQLHGSNHEPDAEGVATSQQASKYQDRLQQLQPAQGFPGVASGSVALEPSFCNDLAHAADVLAPEAGAQSVEPRDVAVDSGPHPLDQAPSPAADASSSGVEDSGRGAAHKRELGHQEAEPRPPMEQPQSQLQNSSTVQQLLQQSCDPLQHLLQGISTQDVQPQQQQQQLVQAQQLSADNELQLLDPQNGGDTQLRHQSLPTQFDNLATDTWQGSTRQEQEQQQQHGGHEEQQPQEPPQLQGQQWQEEQHQQQGNPNSDANGAPAHISQQQSAEHDLQTRRSRQRWQFPEPAADTVPTAGVPETAGDHDQTTQRAAVHSSAGSRPGSRPGSRLSSRQQSRSYSRQGSGGPQESGSSLDVLRSVGERVQGLLEALSRQTSGGGARPTSEAMAASAPVSGSGSGTAATVSTPAPAAAALPATVDAEQAPLNQHGYVDLTSAQCAQDTVSTTLGDRRRLLDANVQSSLAGQHKVCQLQQQQPAAIRRRVTPCHAASPAMAALNKAQLSPGIGETPGPAVELEQQQQEIEQVAADSSGSAGSHVIMQLHEAYQPATDSAQPEHPDANQGTVAADSLVGSKQLVDGDDTAGLAQVEKALQKLQSLRSTLQSIGDSAASSRQPSRGSSIMARTAAFTAGVHPADDSSPRAPTMAQAAAANQPDSCTQESEHPTAPAPAGDWLQQISQRLRDMGADIKSQADGSEPELPSVSTVPTPGAGSLQSPPPQQQASQQLDSLQAASTVGTEAVVQHIANAETSGQQLKGSMFASQLQNSQAASPGGSGGWSGASTRSLGTLAMPDSTSPAPEQPEVQSQQPDPDPMQGYSVQQADRGSGLNVICARGADAAWSPQAAYPAPWAVPGAVATAATAGSTELPLSTLEPAQLHVHKLQQMLDASEDSALLMSLAFKLDSLAKKFKRHGAGFHTTAVAGEESDAHATASNISRSAGPWTSIMHNDLFVASPIKRTPASMQQQPMDHLVQQRYQTDSSAAGSELEVLQPSDVVRDSHHGLVPDEVAAGQPWLELQDAALQQVLGVSLQELQEGGQQVAKQVVGVAVQLKCQLQVFSNQPVMGAHSNSCQGETHATALMQEHVTDGQLQPLLILLLHAYEQVVQQHCRHMILQQCHMPPQGWEETAQATAQQQIQWFVNQQLDHIMCLLSCSQEVGSSLNWADQVVVVQGDYSRVSPL